MVKTIGNEAVAEHAIEFILARTLEELVNIENALEMMPRMKKADFVTCVKDEHKAENGAAWDLGRILEILCGSRIKAINEVRKEMEQR